MPDQRVRRVVRQPEVHERGAAPRSRNIAPRPSSISPSTTCCSRCSSWSRLRAARARSSSASTACRFATAPMRSGGGRSRPRPASRRMSRAWMRAPTALPRPPLEEHSGRRDPRGQTVDPALRAAPHQEDRLRCRSAQAVAPLRRGQLEQRKNRVRIAEEKRRIFNRVCGRGSWIRTNDLQYPKLPRYQAALYPEGLRKRPRYTLAAQPARHRRPSFQ